MYYFSLTLEMFDVSFDLDVNLNSALFQSSVQPLERVLRQPQSLLCPDPPLPLLLPLGLCRLLLLRHLLHTQTNSIVETMKLAAHTEKQQLEEATSHLKAGLIVSVHYRTV